MVHPTCSRMNTGRITEFQFDKIGFKNVEDLGAYSF